MFAKELLLIPGSPLILTSNRTTQNQLWAWPQPWPTRWATTSGWLTTAQAAARRGPKTEAASWRLLPGTDRRRSKTPPEEIFSNERTDVGFLCSSHPFPRVFNDCNLKELKSYLGSGGGKCLFNLPNTRVMYGGQRCGNGYLEEGEECDCGQEEVFVCCICLIGFFPPRVFLLGRICPHWSRLLLQECTSPCCNANNCTLRAGAECAHGVCCHNCKVQRRGKEILSIIHLTYSQQIQPSCSNNYTTCLVFPHIHDVLIIHFFQ